MARNELTRSETKFFLDLGEKIKKIILDDLGYQSLDKFALEHHDKVTKPTLYAICDGTRDFQLSTLLRLSKALNTNIQDLINDLNHE